jgi:hypothetical protein
VTAESDLVTIAASERVDVGDLGLVSFPVRVVLVEACDPIPGAGGDCRFTVSLVNATAGRLQAEAWSLVTASGLAAPPFGTAFQTGVPRPVNLEPGARETLTFTFTVPERVSAGATLCVSTNVSERGNQLDALGASELFCVTKEP